MNWPATKPDVEPVTHGWLQNSTRGLLRSVLNEDTKCVVELGSWLGLSTRFICDCAPKATVYAVDHWHGSEEHRTQPHHPEWRYLLDNLYEVFLASCWEYRGQIVPIKCDTLAGCGRLAFGAGVTPDVVYIDASHDYVSVKSEILWVRYLWPRATVVGDDFDWEGVRRAVEEHPHVVHGIGWRLL